MMVSLSLSYFPYRAFCQNLNVPYLTYQLLWHIYSGIFVNRYIFIHVIDKDNNF